MEIGVGVEAVMVNLKVGYVLTCTDPYTPMLQLNYILLTFCITAQGSSWCQTPQVEEILQERRSLLTNELPLLYDIYKPYVAPFLATITNESLKPLTSTREATSFYTHGMDVVFWLTGATPRPSTVYFASIPISLPLIGLTQLVQYLIVCRVSGLTPGDLRDRISGATGHSQGVVSAVAVAASTTFESFTENAKKAVRWLFFCGLRGQEAFPVLSLEPSIVDDSIEGGEGAPTPMLAVTAECD